MSKLVMGTLLLVGVSLLIVLGLVLVLLAELYCSFLSRRRRIPVTNSSATAENDQKPTEEESKMNTILQESKLRSPFCPSTIAYSQGVLCPPPRALLFGTRKAEAEQQLQAAPKPTSTTLHQIGLISASSQAPPPSSLIPPLPRKKPSSSSSSSSSSQVEIVVEKECTGIVRNSSYGSAAEQFLRISNPIYDEEACIGSTPFQTPDTSPSRFEEEECLEREDATEPASPPAACLLTPPLSPMKKLPPSAASVTLTDGRSLIPSTTDSNASSSTSASPCTSPSW